VLRRGRPSAFAWATESESRRRLQHAVRRY
jgi:hypothetical protein